MVVWSREGLDSLELLIAGLALVGLGVVLIAWDDVAHSKAE
jgi:hypothetical protein